MAGRSTIEPGGKTNIHVTINTTGKYGKMRKILKIKTNDEVMPEAVVMLEANIYTGEKKEK